MRIAICDDEAAQRELLNKYIMEWHEASGEQVRTEMFESSEEFLFHCEDDRAYDLLVLDIEMGNMNGMELARKLRSGKHDMQILFVTGYDKYIAQGYEVEAMHYLIKPVQKQKLFEVLYKAVQKLAKESRHVFKTNEGMLSIKLSDVWYFEADGHGTMLVLEKKKINLLQGISTIKQLLETEEGGQGFVMAHRSYWVNLKHVSAIMKQELILDDGRSIPVSRSRLKELNQAFIRYYKAGKRA